MYVSLWLNTLAAVQIFYKEHIFVFFITLFLKKMRIIVSASKPHCHSRLRKPILKILSIYRTNILGKQFSLVIYFKYVLRLLHALESQIFSSKLNIMVKDVRLFTGVVWKSCSDDFYRKTPMQESFSNWIFAPTV